MNNTVKKVVLVFLKNTDLGHAKTRLAKGVGKEKALEVYKKLLDKTEEVVSGCSCKVEAYFSRRIPDKGVFTTPDTGKHVQVSGDLGIRMKEAFSSAYEKNGQNTKVIIIGSDCFQLTTEIVEEAFNSLDHSDIVIGPAEDGGYYLLGTSFYYPWLFENKSWSTNLLFKETIDDIRKHKLKVKTLTTLNDVDELTDLPEALLNTI